MASSAALLGTSAEGEPGGGPTTTYRFERTGIDGGFAELSRDQPTASFFVTIRADELGPDSAQTTDHASSTLDGSVSTSGLAAGQALPLVAIRVRSPESPLVSEQLILNGPYSATRDLAFSGDCQDPQGGATCAAHFVVEVTRQDEGSSGGVVRFDWMFDVESQTQVATNQTGSVGPLDPPWTVEVTPP